jgi:hypothetical protein
VSRSRRVQRFRGQAALYAGLAFTALACSPPIAPEELPSDPIAFIRQEPRDGIGDIGEFTEALQMRGMNRNERGQRVETSLPRTSVALLTLTTGTVRTVPDSGAGSYPLDWSADGLRLLVGRVEEGERVLRLYSWNRLSGAWDRVSPDRSAGAAAFGPGPIRLGYVGRPLESGAWGDMGVLVYMRGLGVQPLPDAVGGRGPDVSPDGETVVFVRDHPRPDRDGIILSSQLGAASARAIARGDKPRFSRDGEWIVYQRRREGNINVWLMRADGSSKRPVTKTSFDEVFPAVSPDGRYVVYSSARGDQTESQLFVTRVSDLAEIQVTQNSQNGRPVW